MEGTKDESTSTFIQSQLHSVIASQRATIESLRDALKRTHVPRTEYDELASRLEESVSQSTELQTQLDSITSLSMQLQAELDDAHAKLTSTYVVLEQVCAKIDMERAEFETSLEHIRRTTVDEIRKNSELYAKTLAMEQTYATQRQALDAKTGELKQLEKRMTRQETRANNKINKLAVKLEQEKFITREIVGVPSASMTTLTSVKQRNKK